MVGWKEGMRSQSAGCMGCVGVRAEYQPTSDNYSTDTLLLTDLDVCALGEV